MRTYIHSHIREKLLKILVRTLLTAALTLPFSIAAFSQAPPSFPAFYAKSYGGRCLDFGAPPQVIGSPVFIYDCNGTVAQKVAIQELTQQVNAAATRVHITTGGLQGPQPLEPHAVL